MPLDDYVSTSAPASQSAATVGPQPGKKATTKNKDKDVILVNPDIKDVVERVIDVQQRRKLSTRMKRLKSRLLRAREIARMRPASTKQLERRAYKAAKQGIRRKFAGARGAEYQDLSASGKYAVDTLVDPKVKNIRTLVQKIMPRIRQSDSRRLHAARTHQQYKAFVLPQLNSVELDVNDFNRLWEQFVENKSQVVNKDLNESFGAFYTAKDIGMQAEGRFAVHPSVQVVLDEDAPAHLRLAAIAERSGNHMKADTHRKIAAALQRGDMTSANTLISQLKKESLK